MGLSKVRKKKHKKTKHVKLMQKLERKQIRIKYRYKRGKLWRPRKSQSRMVRRVFKI